MNHGESEAGESDGRELVFGTAVILTSRHPVSVAAAALSM